MTVAAVLVAAGSGFRLGADVPKAFVAVAGRPLLEHAHARFAAHPRIATCVVVAPADRIDDAAAVAPGATVVAGGATRQESVAAGLAALGDDVDTVLVHDVARAFVPAEVIDRVLDALADGVDAAIPVLPVTDTVKQVDDDNVVVATIDRTQLVAVQTPQAFRRAALANAHAHAADSSATDDALLVESDGGVVTVVKGDEDAFKITHARDLVLAEAVIARG
ncbi:MAG TPA: 2-C-methyl-D-erythritol 4-phosphate cytidylyltransferase [Jatrophihabitantaceae bacterium]|nr:2-C-methyl-D-erythritol 4-phosphate cytidylyltransferase [Jatrophihabitantaceae bacterium]